MKRSVQPQGYRDPKIAATSPHVDFFDTPRHAQKQTRVQTKRCGRGTDFEERISPDVLEDL
jgi:hypothetical protein